MSNNAKIREEAKKLNPIDDLMFRKLAEDKEFCQEILRIILDDNELIVTDVEPQWPGSNLKGRSVILDAKCLKGDGQSIDIEVQKADDDDHQRRVRYNGAILTTNTTDTGTKFKQIPDVTVVFISKFDIFEENLPLYHIDRVIRETGKVVDNGFYEVYVNAQIKDGSDVAELMEVFTVDNAYNNKFPKTSEAKHRYKETEAGLDIMCEIMEKLTTDAREEGRLEGIAEGKTKGKIETLISLVANQTLSVTDAANFANMSVQNFSDLMTQR
jgi:predicted transposase/invertase (TIGR01784 family)